MGIVWAPRLIRSFATDGDHRPLDDEIMLTVTCSLGIGQAQSALERTDSAICVGDADKPFGVISADGRSGKIAVSPRDTYCA